MAATIDKPTNGGNQSAGRNNPRSHGAGRRPSNNFLHEFEGDSIIMEVMFSNTDVLNKGFRGHFDGFSATVFFLRRNLLILNDSALRDSLMSELDKLLTDKHKELTAKKDVAKKLIADNNLVIKTSNRGDLRNVRVIDPLANRFLQLIKLADEVGRLFSQLWVAMIIKDNDKSKAINELITLISSIHTFVRQAGSKANKLVKARNSPKSGDTTQDSNAVSNDSNETIDELNVEGVIKDEIDNEEEPLVDEPNDELVGDDDLGDSVKKGATA
jgi:hypothetical protein